MTEVPNRSELLERYRVERLRRLRPDGSDQYVEVTGEFTAYGDDPFATPMQREPRVDDVDVALIGAGFGGLLTGARLRDLGVECLCLIGVRPGCAHTRHASGTDLAALRTRAVRDGDEWVISGQKMWTSLAEYADYVWLAARTDPDVSKHKGLSVFMVPTTSPGFSRQPVHTVTGVTTNATFYDDVRVPAENLIGGESNGWKLITGQLNHERVSLSTTGRLKREIAAVAQWATDTVVDGRRVIDNEWVQHHLARIHAKSAAKLMETFAGFLAHTDHHIGRVIASGVNRSTAGRRCAGLMRKRMSWLRGSKSFA